jgi:hypothetical protein
MTPSMKSTLKILNVEELKLLARQTGPCVTMQVPDYQPGALAGSRSAYLRQLTQTAAERLRHLNRPAETDGILAGLEELASTLNDGHGGPGFAVFAAPGFEAAYLTPGVRSDRVTVASRFDLLPLLTTAQAPWDFYILGLSKNKTRLFHYDHSQCDEVPLPAGVPESLIAAGAFDMPDHRLQNRSTVGRSTGDMTAASFGTLSDREAAPEYLKHFFALLDKGLKDTIKDTPLFLAGVREELAEYRRVAKYGRIFESEYLGTIEYFSAEQVAQQAGAAALGEYHLACEQALKPISEVRDKITGDPEAVLKAAYEGRVRQIFVAEDARVSGPNVAGAYAGEDMVNAAVVEGLRTGADIFSIPGKELPDFGPIAAVLRF